MRITPDNLRKPNRAFNKAMGATLKRIVAYIFRGWDEEPGYTHSRLRILPPFLWEILGYAVGLYLLYLVGSYLLSLLTM